MISYLRVNLLQLE